MTKYSDTVTTVAGTGAGIGFVLDALTNTNNIPADDPTFWIKIISGVLIAILGWMSGK